MRGGTLRRGRVRLTSSFEFRSDPRVALHHFLIDWASADAGQWPSFALPLTEREQWRSVLDAQEQRAWAGAVEAYAASVGRSLLFDPGLRALRDWAVGAYSTGNRLTISSATPGNRMPHAIEMIFHEASHTDSMEQALRSGLGRAFEAVGRAEPDRFWHDVIFYTSGEITRLVLARHGQPGYAHYGSLGVYLRGERWAVHLPLFAAHWTPFLESGSNDASARRAALTRIARGLPGGP